MKIPYTVLDPTGNVTVLAETTPSAPLAARLMAAEPSAEQVGFVSFPEPGKAELRMAGGEFCGNATLCAGILGCRRQNVTEISVRASGAKSPLTVTARRLSEDAFDAEGELPLPEEIEEKRLPTPDGETAFPVVKFPGIAHAVLPRRFPRETAEDLVKRWCEILRVDAMGLLRWDEAGKTMTPLVYVPAAGTLFWENSCASGSAAVGAWMAKRDEKPVEVAVRQPGGVLRITAGRDRILLRETVRVVKTGELEE